MDRAATSNRGLQGTDSHSHFEWTERLPLALLAVAMVISTWLVLSLNSGLTFINDEWDPLINRPGWGIDQIFAEFNGHPTMIPMVIYKTVQEIFGMDSTRPFQVIHAALLLVMNGALFVYLRRRVGDWAALIGTVMILFLGAAFEVLIYSFAMNFVGAIAVGIGALLALDRDDDKGDVAAAALLTVGVFFSMVIVPFIVAAAVEVLLNPRGRRERAFVPGAPFAVLFIWWAIWGRESDQSSVTLSGILSSPGAIFDALGSGFTSLFGLATGYGSEANQPNLVWGKLFAIASVALVWWRLKVLGRFPKDFLVIGSAFVAYLVILGIDPGGGREPTFSRFQLPTAVFILMLASTLLEGIRMKTAWLIVGAVIAILSIQGGVGLWQEQATGRWVSASQYVRSLVTGFELSSPDLRPDAIAFQETWGSPTVGEYLEAANRYGSPAFSASAIGALEPGELSWIDSGLVEGTGVGLDGDPPELPPSTCRGAGGELPIEVEPGRYRVENASNGELTVLVSRLGPAPGNDIGAVLPDSAAGLDLPAGDLSEPWRVSFEPSSPQVRLCGP